jgi:hypothetical protein
VIEKEMSDAYVSELRVTSPGQDIIPESKTRERERERDRDRDRGRKTNAERETESACA